MFDSHAHYDDKAFNEDREQIIKAIHDEGVDYILNAGSNIETSKISVELSQKYNFVYAAVGVHPHNAQEAPKNYLDELKALCKNKKVVAIGEIGLDYHYDFSPRELQKQIFIEQIKLARELKLPIVVHDRESHEDVMNILKEEAEEVDGVMHCFSGSLDMAKEIIKIGLYVGIGGSVTFTNARKIIEVVENIPIEYILSETDCPYLTPVPFRGRRNDSRYMKYVIEKIAQIKNMGFEETEKILSDNAKRLFKIDKQ